MQQNSFEAKKHVGNDGMHLYSFDITHFVNILKIFLNDA